MASALRAWKVYYVAFREVVDWMNAQDRTVMAAMQHHRSNLRGCPYVKCPNCEASSTDPPIAGLAAGRQPRQLAAVPVADP